MRLVRGSLCVVIVAAGCVSSSAQTWTYQGSNICYQSMCFSQGTLTSAAGGLLQSQVSRQSWQQQNATQAGAAVGSLIGTLIAAWIQHHQQVKAEEKALKLELLKYVDAKIEVLHEMKKTHQDSAQQVLELKQLDPSHGESWDALQKSMEEVIALDDKMIQLNVDYRSNVEKNFRTKKGLDYALNDKQSGAKNLYANDLNLAAVAYVMNQFYRAVLGYIKYTMQVARLGNPIMSTELRLIMGTPKQPSRCAASFWEASLNDPVPMYVLLQHYAEGSVREDLALPLETGC